MKINCKIKSAIVSAGIALLMFGNSCKKNSQRVLPDYNNNRITGNEFSRFGLSGIKFSSLLDSAGKWHNDYQEELLTEMTIQKVNLLDTIRVKAMIDRKSADFFKGKGIFVKDNMSHFVLGKVYNGSFENYSECFSREAVLILSELKMLTKTFVEYNSAFVSSLELLKQKALKLRNPTEIVAVGVPVSVAFYSFKYWSEKADYWRTLLKVSSSEASSYQLKKEKCKVSLPKLGGADVGGAVSGGIGGSTLGPGGTFAGAVLGSSTSSLYNLTNQVISCYVSWWPF